MHQIKSLLEGKLNETLSWAASNSAPSCKTQNIQRRHFFKLLIFPMNLRLHQPIYFFLARTDFIYVSDGKDWFNRKHPKY